MGFVGCTGHKTLTDLFVSTQCLGSHVLGRRGAAINSSHAAVPSMTVEKGGAGGTKARVGLLAIGSSRACHTMAFGAHV